MENEGDSILMKRLIPQFFVFHFSLCVCLLAGCFDEPEPAYKTVPAESRLYLQDQGLRDLKSSDLSKVGDYLNLDRNQLTNVDEVATLAGLKWLRLNSNRLTSLPDLKALVNLRRIYLKDNRFAEVPETLRDLPALTDVDLSGNPITEVPEWLAKKEGLENLSFSRTQITKLPDDLSAWKSLKTLQLGDLRLDPAEMARIRAAFDPKDNPLGTAVVF